MIEIDGSYGEGGGQILRTSIALSAIIGENIIIRNIRCNRPQKGLKPQHLRSIQTMALMCDANVRGLFPGSTEICFSPSEIRGVEQDISIGTAGSIPLLMQSIMPMAACSSGKTKLRITGGTDVSWSPSIDYMTNVTMKALSKMGYKASIRLIDRGYYPKGKGIAEIEIRPSAMKAFDFKPGNSTAYGISHCSNLPEHVPRRQAYCAKTFLEKNGIKTHIDFETKNLISTGSGITLWSDLIGSVSIGKKGHPAEKVGMEAAKMLLDDMRSKAAVDIHLADQLIPYIGLAGEGTFTTRVLTEHCLTNIHITEQLLDVRFSINKTGGLEEVSLG
ncbi:RNA 3'-terminal phosphate cyclase [Methanolobus sp. WCC5]|uniref:RNA 3'-terminal phosphate cyclase n=1 Tax=Methanolobus sp. WCC5 TaxID=3125785 RepID=UPI00325478FD